MTANKENIENINALSGSIDIPGQDIDDLDEWWMGIDDVDQLNDI